MLLLLAISVSLTAAAAQSSQSKAYESNTEYLYEYETQALTGIPQGSTIYSGMKIKSDVRIQFRSRSSVTMQMDKLTFAKINDPIESVDPTQEQIPVEMFTPLTGTDAEQMIKDLSRPINFRYVRGNVRDIEHEAEDPEWSVNVKKGLLSLLEMNLEKRKEVEQSSSIPQVLRPQSSNEGSMYSVMEPSIGGDCETLYRVSPWASTSGNPVMHITKVRNYQNCLDRPMFFSSMFNLRQCAECVKEKSEPLRSASQVRYTVRGNMRQFHIQSAIAESQHVFTPYSTKGGHIATYLNQTLNLIKAEDIAESLPQLKSPTKANSGLQYTSEDIESRDDATSKSQPAKGNDKKVSAASQEAPSPNASPKPSTPSAPKSGDRAKERIRKLLKMLEVFMKPTIQQEAGPLLISLLEEIRKADSESLRAVYREVFQTATSDSKQFKMFMDILPSAGTLPAADVLVNAIMNDHFPVAQAIVGLNSLSLSARPDVLIAKRLLDLIKSSQVSQNRYLKRAAYLCLGALAGRLREEGGKKSREISRLEEIVKSLISRESNAQSKRELKSKKREIEDRKKQERSIYSKLKQEIVKEILTLMKSTVFDDKVLSFKTIGNAGLKEMIPSIRAYIEDKSQPQMLRAQAIYSLRKLARHFPQDIQSTLMPIYFDRSEKEEVRIASYLIVASTEPSRQLLEMVAQSLHSEMNPHVGTFVYTHLEQMSNSSYPCLMTWAKNATFAMRFAKKYSPLYHYSRFMHLSGYDDRIKMGAAAELGLITTPEEFIPRAGALHLNTHVFGSSVNFAEVGFNTEGLQTLVSKLIGPLGEITKSKSIVDVLKQRVRRSVQPEEPSDPISQIHKQLKVSPRTSPAPKGHMYMKLMGNELTYFSLDGTFMDTLIREGKMLSTVSEEDLKNGLNVDIHRSTMPFDARISIPTECGLPLHLKLCGTAAIKVTGKIGITGVPSLFAINRPGQLAKELNLDMELRPSIIFDLRGEMEIDAEYFKTGAALKTMSHIQTPLSMTASADLQKAKIFTKFDVEKLSEKVAQLKISPMTYFKEEPADISKYPMPRETQDITVAKNAKVFPLSMAYGKNVLGLEVALSGQCVVSDFEMDVPYYPMIGKQELFITLSPGVNPQKYFEVQFQFMTHASKATEQTSTSEDKSSGGLLSWVSTWIGSDQPDESPTSSSSSAPPKDIRSKDASLAALLQHLRGSRSIHPEGSVISHNNSMGFVFNVIGMDQARSIKRHLQINMAAGMDYTSRMTSILFSVNRSPIPEMETKPWNMDVAINVHLPSRIVDPSELLSDSYQRELDQQIEVYVRRHGESDYHRWIDREVPRRETSVLQRLLSSIDTQQVIDEVVNTEMSKSSPTESKVIELIRKQKRILKEVRNIRHRSSDPLRVQGIKSMLSSLMTKSENVKKELEKEATSVPKSEKVDALCKYSTLLQQIIEQKLEKSVRSSRRSLSSIDRQNIQKSIESSQESLRKILQLQRSSQLDSTRPQPNPKREFHPDSQSSAEKSEPVSVIEINSKSAKESLTQKEKQDSESSEQISVSSSVSSALSKAVSDLLQSQENVIQEISKSKESEGLKSIDEKKIKETLRMAQEVTKMLRQESSSSSSHSIEKEKHRLLKSVIQQQQIIKCLEQRVSKPGKSETEKKKLRSVMQQIKHENSRISKLVAISSQHEEEKEETRGKLSSDEQDILRRLRQIQLSQIVAAQQLAPAEYSTEESKADESKAIQKVKESMDILDKSGKELVAIINKGGIDKLPTDVVRKLVEVSHMQHSLLGLIAERAKKELVKSVSRNEAKDAQTEKLEQTAETKQVEYLQILRSVMNVVSLKRSVSSISSSDRQSLQSVHKEVEDVRSKQIEIEKKVRSIQQDKEVSAKSPDSSSLKELVLKCKAVQDKIEKVESDIRSRKLHQRVDDTTSEPLRRIDIQRQLVEKVKKIIPDSVMSSQEKDSLNASIRSQVSKLEELHRKLKELERRESQQPKPNQSQSSSQLQPQKNDKNLLPVDKQTNSDKSSQKPQSQQQSKDQPRSDKQLSSKEKIVSSARGDILGDMGREVRISLKAEYGVEGEKRKSFDIQILGTPSLEQILWEKAQRSPLERSSITRKYLQQKSNGSEEVTSTYLRLSLELNMIRHLHARIHFEKNEIPRMLEEFSWRTHEALKAMMYRRMYTEYPHSFRPQDRLEILLDLRRNNKQFDTELRLPEESNFFRGIWMPYFGPFMFESVQSIREGVHRSFPKTMSSISSRLPGQCEMKLSQIRTMDGKEYMIPDTKDCEVVMAMDCSSNKQFAVKSRKDSDDSTKTVVEVHIESRKLEIVPGNSSLDVQVDGNIRQVPEGSSINLKGSTLHTSSEPERIEISRRHGRVSITASKKGVRVSSDGRKISIKISPFYYSKVCGLCGNFDGRQANEYQSPGKVDQTDSSCHVLDYIVPDGKCDSQSVQRECQQPQSSSSRCRLESKTIRRTRLHKDVSQLCLSQSPVKYCPSNCQPRDSKSTAINMVCLSHDSPKARELEKASFLRPLTEELKSLQADYTEYVQVPMSCGEL